ncbi:hypothetical protein [Burkholderia gladioli]|uniref:hypothetical protein n=1 Tax=Burkholderia gladioli TaxID=28095 RepID=UPI00164049D1|nr:hypothetical protein [Burkholderia gladioli]MBJ9675234.1 hypothetical protein [Burkholderia gladioli]MDN7463486.1 hypothetical protein [Burkholderia gladioli]
MAMARHCYSDADIDAAVKEAVAARTWLDLLFFAWATARPEPKPSRFQPMAPPAHYRQ